MAAIREPDTTRLPSFVVNASLTLASNPPPEFQNSETCLSLRYDDAVCEALDESQCASALGSHGAYY